MLVDDTARRVEFRHELLETSARRILRRGDSFSARADPNLLPAEIDELVRYDGATEVAISRFITGRRDDHPRRRAVVLLALAGADRDPDRFAPVVP